MARRLLTIAALGLAMTGCVSNEKYQALKLEKDQLVEENGHLQSEASQARAAADAWKAQLDRLINNSEGAQKNAAILTKENAELLAQIDALKSKYDAVAGRDPVINISSPVNEPLNNALIQLAQQYPDVFEYDASRGIMKFKSDVTFAAGSAELTPNAKAAAAKLATILNSESARPYEFIVAGHTDNTPVSNPNTIRAGHKDNWYLSSHRAIAVGAELVAHRISAERLGVLGYADQRPVASNATAEGKARNRRVEVMILPTSYKSSYSSGSPTMATTGTPKRTVTPKKPAPEFNKDAPVTSTDKTPIFSK